MAVQNPLIIKKATPKREPLHKQAISLVKKSRLIQHIAGNHDFLNFACAFANGA
jgi:hypothetical protein